MIGNYRTRKFTDIYPTFADFKEASDSTPFKDVLTDANLQVLYYLLYGQYGNSHIANYDETQFKYRLFSIIYQYGPNWQLRLKRQQDLIKLTDSDVASGSKTTSDHAYNPSTPPNTEGEEIETINQQDRTRFTKGKVEAYSEQIAAVETDVTAYFLSRFKELFIVVAVPYSPLWYLTNEDGSPEDNSSDDNTLIIGGC